MSIFIQTIFQKYTSRLTWTLSSTFPSIFHFFTQKISLTNFISSVWLCFSPVFICYVLAFFLRSSFINCLILPLFELADRKKSNDWWRNMIVFYPDVIAGEDWSGPLPSYNVSAPIQKPSQMVTRVKVSSMQFHKRKIALNADASAT